MFTSESARSARQHKAWGAASEASKRQDRNPKLVEIEPAIAPPNTLGLRSVMFTVESVDDTVARLRANGAELVGEVAQYEDKYRLCYMRGPAGIIVALAEELFGNNDKDVK